uniref:ubiquitinyl hydrolase 1 n=1 Tax=Fusarium oxysporum (strain Fo5176) TaxID=660025 RepID=A0A0D2XII0_FUSOF
MPPPVTSIPPRKGKSDNEKPLSLNDALYNHLVLPPQLPQRQDSNLDELEKALVNRLLASVKHLRDLPENDQSYVWSLIERGLRATKSIHAGGHVDRTALIRELNDFGESDFLVVYVRSQNCALYIRRSQDAIFGASVIFEAFETSARNEDVLATENALQWDFPGCAVAVPLATFRENGFVSNLANFLDNASRESLTDFSAQALKAGTSMPEFRNTSEPALISSMLMAILQQNGRRLAPTLLQKMVRDDVLWNNAERPWKRLPYWLVLRVAISRYLAQRLGDIGRVEYKFLLAHLFSEFLIHVQQSGGIRLDRLDFLKKKICRRLVKLEVDKNRSQNLAQRIEYLFTQLGPGFQNSISKANAFIEVSWKHQKLTMTKTIPPLPKQASFEDMKLNLKISGITLNKIWRGYSKPFKFNPGRQGTTNVAQGAKQHLSSFAREHFKLIDKELTVTSFCHEQSFLPRSKVGDAASLINEYLRQAFRAYDGIPELKSTLILNIMDLWVTMDKAACAMYPLLSDFHPVFRPEMLDVLLLSAFDDMKRLQKIQVYLQDRIAACQGSTISIFDDPVRGSFGHRFYDDSDMSDEMNDLHESIETWATHLRDTKEKEWKLKSEEYSRLSKVIDESTCVYMVDEDNPHLPPYHDRDCRRCYLKRQLKRISIQAYEHPLPSDPHVARAVVFELLCPQTLAKYRDATWTVMSIALPAEEGVDPKCWARDYQQLQKYANDSSMSCSLASVTKPSFPIEWDNGRYGLEIPDSSPFSQQDAAFFKSIYGPSSYEIMATASRCPQGINVHEYLAFQTVSSGKSRRWLSILVELASANLNFSNEATMLLVTHLSLQCGPLDDSRSEFRIIHEVFRDRSFCETFMEQISHRLDSLAANWREIYLMETIVTFTLRLLDFSWAARMPKISDQTIFLLIRARNTCVRWFKLLRAESYKVVEAETARRFQQYGLWAALLCKRTYVPLACGRLEFDDLSLEIFIQSSITVNDSLVVKLEALPQLLQHAIIRDIRLSYRLAPVVSNRIVDDLEVFRRSLCEMWPEEEGCPRVFLGVKLDPEAPDWVFCRSRTGDSVDSIEQTVSFNCIRGLLLVDSQPMGKLPEDPKYSVVLNELFGNQALLTFPSRRPEMQYILCVRPHGYQVHVGYGSGTQELILQCQIDKDQDAGTWYGLRSKLVCTSLANPMHRSILVPLGPVSARSEGCHVTVRVEPSDKFGRFNINSTLGRIDCAPEPTLVFTKALLHAYRPSTVNIMYRNVLEVTNLILKWPQSFRTTDCIAQILSQGSTVGGFTSAFSGTSINEKLKVNILQHWGSLVRFSRESTDRYKLMYLLGPMSFHIDANMPLLRTIVASAVFSDLKDLELPKWDEFDHFQPNQAPQLDYILHLLKPYRVAVPENDAMGLGQYSSGKLLRKLRIEQAKHEAKVEEDCKYLANHLLSQWPCLEPNVSGLSRSVLIDIGPALEVIRPEWKRLFMNRDLTEHLKEVQTILDRRSLEDRYEPPTVPLSEETYTVRMRDGTETIDLRQLLAKPYRILKATTSTNQIPSAASVDRPFLSEKDFFPGFGNFSWQRNTDSGANSLWPGLARSHNAQTDKNMSESTVRSESSTKLNLIAQRLGACRSAVRRRYAADFQKSLAAFQHTPLTSFKESMKSREVEMHSSLEKVEGGFGSICTALESSGIFSQRRIFWLKAGNLWPIVTKATLLSCLGSAAEVTQFGSGMRKAILEMGVDITKHQRQVRLHDLASKSISGRYHDEESNEGHSNWKPEEHPDWLLLEIESNMMIRPVQVDVALATISPGSGSNSVLQMNMGQGKTSCVIPMAAAALANKKQLVRVIVPKALLQQTAQLLQARLGGILGRGIRHVPFSRRTPTTEKNIRAYHLIHRDMLKSGGVMICQPEHQMSFMLSGRQRLLDEQPAQAGPMIKVQEWLTRVSRDILDESDYTLAAMAIKDRIAVKDFLMHARPSATSIERIRNLSPDKPSLKQTIYLLRGLLVNRILMMTLKKRWNVEYGLHPHRDPIAVPFHAKGVPSDQSEWGHPDVAILFTCLAFYYDGINLAQLRQSLEHILKSDDPSTEYDNWTQSSENFPSSLKAWNSINVDDEMQLGEIWKVVRYNEVVIDYFLNNFVFPRHAKQFEVKLQANGWDIPLSPLGSITENGKETTGKPLSTGFSGTNDNRTMLPFNIEQQDLPSLHHTSAEVLTYLLHPRNRRCILPQDVKIQHMDRATEMDLLFCLKSNSIRILIDAGAQILEMDNYTLVQQWLKIDHFALAGLYFDEENKPWVLTKEGRRTPLLASPFSDDLSNCLVYLDEAHTRGTDLRLPPKAKGALTLRLGQTKDHTVQADVVEWLLDNTCDQIEQLQPLYYSQGMDYCRRMQAALDHPDFLTDKTQRKAYVQAVKQDEQQSLQNLYEPKIKNRAAGMQTSNNVVLKGFIRDLNARRKTFQDTGRAVHASALQEVEQEREVAFEVESVRQVKKPQHFAAFSFPGLNASLEAFIRTGRLPADTNYFTHVFHALSKTGTGRKYKVQPKVTKSKLLETAEFGRTIKPKGDLSTDDFLRPVNWIIWSSVAEIAVIIMPEEAEALIPIMRNSGVPTHLLVYSAPITRKMLRFNDLTFHSIPPLPNDWKAPKWFQVELGIYAGRLYFEWDEYDAMCSLLGIQNGELGNQAQDEEPTETDTDVETEISKPQTNLEHKLAKSPLTFLQEWLAVRRRGQDFAHSPMGFVSHGKRLQEDHVFFKAADIENGLSQETVLAPIRLSSSAENDGQDHGYYGVDDMGANEARDSDSSDDDKIEYDESEYASASASD